MFFCHGSSQCDVVGGLSPPISQNVFVCEHCPRNANRPLRRGYQLCFVAFCCCFVFIIILIFIICFVGDYFGLRTLPGCVGFVGTFVLTNLFCVWKLSFWTIYQACVLEENSRGVGGAHSRRGRHELCGPGFRPPVRRPRRVEAQANGVCHDGFVDTPIWQGIS